MRIKAYQELVALHFYNGSMQTFAASAGSTRIENGRMYFSGKGGGISSVSMGCITAVYVDGSRIF